MADILGLAGELARDLQAEEAAIPFAVQCNYRPALREAVVVSNAGEIDAETLKLHSSLSSFLLCDMQEAFISPCNYYSITYMNTLQGNDKINAKKISRALGLCIN